MQNLLWGKRKVEGETECFIRQELSETFRRKYYVKDLRSWLGTSKNK